MSRIIKFRAWEPSISKMFNQALVGDSTNPSILTNDGWKNCTETVVIMQFTGLLDKNGKEIYEGDIVLCNEMIGIVNKRVDYFVDTKIKDEDFEEISFDKLWKRTMEVIGNVYENSELVN